MDENMDFTDESDANLAALAYRFALEAKKYEKLADDAKREMRKRFSVTEYRKPYAFGKLLVTVKEFKKFDEATAEKNLSAAKFKKIQVPKASGALAKSLVKARVLTAAEYEACRKQYDNTITFNIAEG